MAMAKDHFKGCGTSLITPRYCRIYTLLRIKNCLKLMLKTSKILILERTMPIHAITFPEKFENIFLNRSYSPCWSHKLCSGQPLKTSKLKVFPGEHFYKQNLIFIWSVLVHCVKGLRLGLPGHISLVTFMSN